MQRRPPSAKPRLGLALLFAATLPLGCGSVGGTSGHDPAPAVDAAPTPEPAASAQPTVEAREDPSYAELVRSLSEPDAAFFSDNYVSNETSYLDVAPDLETRGRTGGAYIGVGPEQNFSYIALTRPRVAFIVDIRRQNLILHLLYRAAFEEASSRSHFVALLLGRPYEAESAPVANASLEDVLAHAERHAADAASFAAAHDKLRDRVASWGAVGGPEDFRSLEASHRAFFKAGLGLRFELHAPSGRKYPTLRELYATEDPNGRRAGFLATEESFRFVQTLEREGRVIPVVGDFAGPHAVRSVGDEIRRRGLVVSAFYVSNVEQYLFAPGVWNAWCANVASLPTDDASLFVRAYLDQGRRHPRQAPGQRTVTLLQRVTDFEARQARKPYRSFWDVATDGS